MPPTQRPRRDRANRARSSPRCWRCSRRERSVEQSRPRIRRKDGVVGVRSTTSALESTIGGLDVDRHGHRADRHVQARRLESRPPPPRRARRSSRRARADEAPGVARAARRRTRGAAASALSAPVTRKSTSRRAPQHRQRQRDAVDERLERRLRADDRGARVSSSVGCSGKSEAMCPSGPSPSSRRSKRSSDAELLLVRARALLAAELAAHPVHARGRPRAGRAALLRQPVVRALVVRRHAALVAPPELDASSSRARAPPASS